MSRQSARNRESKPKSPIGKAAPKRYSEKLAEAILERVGSGESLRAVCADPDMPAVRTVLYWAEKDIEGFRSRYALAMDFRAQIMFEEMLEIADEVTDQDTIRFTRGEDVVELPNKEWILRSKLRVDARKWALARMAPKRYGDKITQEISGPGGGPIVTEGGLKITPEDEEFIRRRAEIVGRVRTT